MQPLLNLNMNVFGKSPKSRLMWCTGLDLKAFTWLHDFLPIFPKIGVRQSVGDSKPCKPFSPTQTLALDCFLRGETEYVCSSWWNLLCQMYLRKWRRCPEAINASVLTPPASTGRRHELPHPPETTAMFLPHHPTFRGIIATVTLTETWQWSVSWLSWLNGGQAREHQQRDHCPFCCVQSLGVIGGLNLENLPYPTFLSCPPKPCQMSVCKTCLCALCFTQCGEAELSELSHPMTPRLCSQHMLPNAERWGRSMTTVTTRSPAAALHEVIRGFSHFLSLTHCSNLEVVPLTNQRHDKDSINVTLQPRTERGVNC